jgi:D123
MDEIDLQPKLPSSLPFSPLTKSHILNCSYHSWHPKYRASTPKSRLIPLPEPFLSYLRSDGIILPHDAPSRPPHDWSDNDSGIFSEMSPENNDSDDDEDPAADWRDLHDLIRETIRDLGGSVVPKLNWSAPKDATWMTSNTLQCRSPDDIYLLLKSSDFITHDLEHAFDDCIDDTPKMTLTDIPYHLVLRKYFQLNPSLEFRCFVRRRKIIGICQRDLNHFAFLVGIKDQLRRQIVYFFNDKLRDTFPDESFVFDVYIPPPHEKVWLVDINPWAARTDPLLFSWLELITMVGFDEDEETEDQSKCQLGSNQLETLSGEDVEKAELLPEFRLVNVDDPETRTMSSKFSAHKLPKDVVEASLSGELESLQDFASRWKGLMDATSREQQDDQSSDGDDKTV